MTLRHRLRAWQILEPAPVGDRLSRAFDVFLLAMVGLNIAAVVLESMPVLAQRWNREFRGFETFSILIFTMEYLLRLWACGSDPRYRGWRGKWRYARTPAAITDLLAVAPFYLPMLGVDLRVLRGLRLFRVFRIAKLGRYSTALPVILGVIRQKRGELAVALLLMMLLLLVGATVMYHLENAAQPDVFPHIPAALWWAIVTITTVGYGDVVPLTTAGRVVAGMVAVLGIGFFALPTSILGSGFLEALKEKEKHARCPHCGGDLTGEPDHPPRDPTDESYSTPVNL